MRKRWPKERTMDAVVRRAARLGVKGEGPDQISRMRFGVSVFTRTAADCCRTVLAEPQKTALVTGNSHTHTAERQSVRGKLVCQIHTHGARARAGTRTRLASRTSYGLGHRPGGPFFLFFFFFQRRLGRFFVVVEQGDRCSRPSKPHSSDDSATRSSLKSCRRVDASLHCRVTTTLREGRRCHWLYLSERAHATPTVRAAFVAAALARV